MVLKRKRLNAKRRNGLGIRGGFVPSGVMAPLWKRGRDYALKKGREVAVEKIDKFKKQIEKEVVKKVEEIVVNPIAVYEGLKDVVHYPKIKTGMEKEKVRRREGTGEARGDLSMENKVYGRSKYKRKGVKAMLKQFKILCQCFQMQRAITGSVKSAIGQQQWGTATYCGKTDIDNNFIALARSTTPEILTNPTTESYYFEETMGRMMFTSATNGTLKLTIYHCFPKDATDSDPFTSMSADIADQATVFPAINRPVAVDYNSSPYMSRQFRKDWYVRKPLTVTLQPGSSHLYTFIHTQCTRYDEETNENYKPGLSGVIFFSISGTLVHDATVEASVDVGAVSCDWRLESRTKFYRTPNAGKYVMKVDSSPTIAGTGLAVRDNTIVDSAATT